MILSFFVFLIISCSMLFGMTSFIIGFRDQLPSETFASQKETVTINTAAFKYDKGNAPDRNFDYLSDESYKNLQSFYLEETKPFINTDQKERNIDWIKLMDGKSLLNLLDNNQKVDPAINKDEAKNFINYVYRQTDSYSLTSYWFEKNIYNKGIIDVDGLKPKIWNYNVLDFQKDKVGYGTNRIYLFDSNDKYLTDTRDGYYTNPEYKNKTNVVFSSYNTRKNMKYKLGQKIVLTVKDETQSFTYGGVFSPDIRKNYSDVARERDYFIENYKPENKSNWPLANANQGKSLIIWYSENKSNKDYRDWVLNDILNAKLFAKGNTLIDSSKRFGSYYSFYTAMFMLDIILIVILLVLDIILSWFLIKQIIENLASQLLFLKAMGLKDSEASLINAVGILGILVIAIGLSLVGMLGVQFVFTNMITNFMDIILSWSDIQAMSLILVFGLLAFLFGIYFASNYLLIKKLNISSSMVVKKSDFAFSRIRSYIFNKNVNVGITFAFNVKNLSKMLVALIITLLMTVLTFVSAQFITSIDQNVKQINNFNDNKETLSFIKPYQIGGTDDYVPIKYESSPTKDEEFKDPNELLSAYLRKKTGYITRETIDKNSNSNNPVIDSLKKIEKEHDKQVESMWPNAKDFIINFGLAYENGAESFNSFSISFTPTSNIDRNNLQMIVLNDKSSKAKEIFNNDHSFAKDKFLPLVTSGMITKNWNSHSVYDLGNPLIYLNGNKKQTKIDARVAQISTKICDPQLAYVRESDFREYLKTLSDSSYALNQLNSKIGNTFSNDGVPEYINQIIIPLGMKLNLISPFTPTISFLKLQAQGFNNQVKPLSYALLVILILGIILMITFIIFMNMTIMQENDNIIFIMKALGYSKYYILRRIITGYFLAIICGIAGGLLISWGLLGVLNKAFLPIIYTNILFYWTWLIIVLIIAFVFVLSGITLSITSAKIHNRSLTKREE